MSLGVAFFFFFNDTATTEIYTLSLHDALPISLPLWRCELRCQSAWRFLTGEHYTMVGCRMEKRDRKSTRLNSSHGYISYAVFCLKKKKITTYDFTLHTEYTYFRH